MRLTAKRKDVLWEALDEYIATENDALPGIAHDAAYAKQIKSKIEIARRLRAELENPKSVRKKSTE